MLEIRDVSKSYGTRRVLDDVSFDVAPGRMTGFVGGNGAGKTTTMRIVLGVLEPDAGTVTLDGAPLGPIGRRRFGYMPEERGLYPKMKLAEQLVYLARLHGLNSADAARSTEALLARLSLSERANDPVEKLSLGNQQRAQIAAALVHDDIIDNSDIRRGRPAAHRAFESLHRRELWDGDAAAFGTSTAILLGDLLLFWSDELFEDGLALLDDPESARAARAEFFRMRTEVTVGQYLDVLEEDSWRSRPDSEALPRAHRVIVYKSAKYSVEAPLAIGGALAGGSLPQLAALREFGLPLGVAFQLRDDMLGVFGDPEVTGKPSGDDLREGKRTVLIGLARQKMPPTAVRVLDELLGDPGLDEAQVRMLQNTVRDSGAAEQVERIIAHNVRVAREALEGAPLSASARSELSQLADRVTRRDA